MTSISAETTVKPTQIMTSMRINGYNPKRIVIGIPPRLTVAKISHNNVTKAPIITLHRANFPPKAK